MSDIAVERLTPKIMRDLAAGLNAEKARWLVDYYYSIQKLRIEAQGRVRAIVQDADQGTFQIGEWLHEELSVLERRIVLGLDEWTSQSDRDVWAKSITGIGPVLAAGLAAHIDIAKAPTVGHIWAFGGYDPGKRWEKGEKRPWNSSLKVLFWKIGDSFVKVSGRESDVYGKVYRARKALEVERNEKGLFADQAAKTLSERKFRDADVRKVYESGRLPDGRIDLRARRYAVKLFLSGWHEVAYFTAFGELPPKPYVISHLKHAHYIAPPNLHLVPGLREARRAARL